MNYGTKIEKNPIAISEKDARRFFTRIESRIGVKLNADVATDAIHEILQNVSTRDWDNIDSLKEHIAEELLKMNLLWALPSNGWGADDHGRYSLANWTGEFYLALQGWCLPNRDAMLSDSELDDLRAVVSSKGIDN